MDHNLGDTLNLESGIEVEFDKDPDVVEEGENLDTDHAMMEYNNIEEPIMMETGNEEIVSDLINDQFHLSPNYTIDSEEVTETITDEIVSDVDIEPTSVNIEESIEYEENIEETIEIEDSSPTEENSSLLSQQNESLDMQYENPQSFETVITSQSDITTSPQTVIKIQKPIIRESASLPRQIAIAPRQIAIAPRPIPFAKLRQDYSVVKRNMPIAPKPITMVKDPLTGNFKKVPVSLVQGGSTVLAQIGKQLTLLMPPGSGKVKLVQNADGVQYVRADGDQAQFIKTSSGKSIIKTMIVQGDSSGLLTKVTPGIQQGTRIVSVSKKSSAPHLIPIQSKDRLIGSERPATKITSTSNTMLKKMLIPANKQTMLLKSVTSKPGQVLKGNVINVTSGPPRMQLHQVHVPGKGVQYIRLVTKPTGNKPGERTPEKTTLVRTIEPHKKMVLTDNKVVTKKKIIKVPAAANQPIPRSPKSLLAPINRTPNPEPVDKVDKEPEDSKEILRQLIEEVQDSTLHEVEVECERMTSAPTENSNCRLVESEDEVSKKQVETALKSLLDQENFEKTAKEDLESRPRKPCNCTKSLCLKLYCECFANGEFCKNCNCTNCHNNLEHEELRRSAIMGCLERNPSAFKPKIGKAKCVGPVAVRRHNKGCNCKRSGCLKNYCECYEAKIACSANCKCFGCRNTEDGGKRPPLSPHAHPKLTPTILGKRPCNVMTPQVIEAACQCLLAAAAPPTNSDADPVSGVLTEFARCLQEIIASAQHA